MSSFSSILRKPFEPLMASSRGYNAKSLRADAVAGLTVAVVAVPQSMAYALIAGVPVQYGLYTVIIQCFICSFFNSQPFLSAGPIITQSLLVASIVTRLVDPGQTALYLQLVIALALLKGLMQLTMAAARLGNLIRYVSQSVTVGFTAGAGVLIAVGQIHWFLGFSVHRTKEQWPGLIGAIQRLLGNFEQISIPSIIMGSICLVLVLVARRVSKVLPGPLIAVIASGAMVAALGWTATDLPLISKLPASGELLHLYQIPTLHMTHLEALLQGALALSLLGLLEVYSIGKAISAKTGHPISANQELLSQGLGNAVSSFFQCFPGSGSFSRSALTHFAGAKTRYAGLFNTLFILIIFLVFAPWATYIPMACLAAILFVIAYGLIDFNYLKRVFQSNRADTTVCVATFLATITIPLAYAVFIGIFLNLALYIQRASQLHLNEMIQTHSGPFIERPIQEKSGKSSVLFLQIEGDLFFGIADELGTRLNQIIHKPCRVVIFRLKRTFSIDTTVLWEVENFVKQMKKRDRHVILCGIKPELMEIFQRFGLTDLVGHENIFETSFGVFTSAKRALERARELIDGSIDMESIADLNKTEGWSYEI